MSKRGPPLQLGVEKTSQLPHNCSCISGKYTCWYLSTYSCNGPEWSSKPWPSPGLRSPPSLSNFYEEADSNSHAVRYLQSPPASIFTLSYEWSSRLQSGLEWLAERVVPQPAPPLIVKYEAKLTPQPLPASLADIFQSHVNCLFLSPLIVLIREWAAQNFYEPVGHIDFARCRK